MIVILKDKDYDIIISILNRAEKMGLFRCERISHLMDIEVACKVFKINLKRWVEADDENFCHDFCGIYENINRDKAFLGCKDSVFNCFVPRYAENTI